MANSIFDRFGSFFDQRKELSEEKKKEVLKQIEEGKHTAGVQAELYKINIDEAIADARRAIRAKDAAGKAAAMQRLKAYYGLYRYMNLMHNAFMAMQSHTQIQAATQEFADMVNGFSKINIQKKPVNFEELMRKVSKNLKPMDTTGLEKMVNGLVGYSAGEASTAEDAFLESLVSGQSTLDAFVSPEAVEEAVTVTPENADDMMKILNQMQEALNNQ